MVGHEQRLNGDMAALKQNDFRTFLRPRAGAAWEWDAGSQPVTHRLQGGLSLLPHTPHTGCVSRSTTGKLFLDHLNDAAGVNAHSVRLSKMKNHVAVFRRAEVVTIQERILGPIGEAYDEWPEGSPLDQILDVCYLHFRIVTARKCSFNRKVLSKKAGAGFTPVARLANR